jgi:hypothetical protein
MEAFYNVTTPRGQRRCKNELHVREHVAEYMQTQGASLNEVSVIYVPDARAQAVNPQPRSPRDFWESAK